MQKYLRSENSAYSQALPFDSQVILHSLKFSPFHLPRVKNPKNRKVHSPDSLSYHFVIICAYGKFQCRCCCYGCCYCVGVYALPNKCFMYYCAIYAKCKSTVRKIVRDYLLTIRSFVCEMNVATTTSHPPDDVYCIAI